MTAWRASLQACCDGSRWGSLGRLSMFCGWFPPIWRGGGLSQGRQKFCRQRMMVLSISSCCSFLPRGRGVTPTGTSSFTGSGWVSVLIVKVMPVQYLVNNTEFLQYQTHAKLSLLYPLTEEDWKISKRKTTNHKPPKYTQLILRYIFLLCVCIPFYILNSFRTNSSSSGW